MHSCFNRWRLIVVGCTLVLLEVHSECVRDLLQDHFKFDVFVRREQHRIALQVLKSAACQMFSYLIFVVFYEYFRVFSCYVLLLLL